MLIDELFTPSIKAMNGYKVNEEKHSIKMDDNSSPYNMPAKVKNELLKKFKNLKFNRYPEPYHNNLLRLAAELCKVKTSNISFGNGSDEIIEYLLQMFINHSNNDKVLIVTPSFVMYEIVPKIMGIEVIKIPLIETAETWELDVKAIAENIKNVKLIFLATPNNPTGNIFKKNKIMDIIKLQKCIVAVDEAYFDYASETFIPQIKRFENLIVMRTFSKGFGLAGGRLGFLISNSKIIDCYNKTRLPYNVNSLSALAAETALENFSIIKKNIDELCGGRKFLYDSLKKFKNLNVYKSDSNFILVRSTLAENIYKNLLTKFGILVKLFKDKPLDNCLRITVGSPSENKALLSALQKIII